MKSQSPKKSRDKKPSSLSEEQRALALYAAKMATLSEMAGGIAHEINTPLAVISTLSGQMRENLEVGDVDRASFLSAAILIEETTMRIAKIVTGLQTFAREEIPEIRQEIPVRELIDGTMAFCRQRFLNKGVEIEMIFPKDDQKIVCSIPQISQALLNLLQNAHDAVLKTGNRWIRIEVQDTDDLVEIAIVDSGPGISIENADKIFMPFFSTKDVGTGQGLGLCVSRSIVENHGGTLKHDRQSSETRFVIALPKMQSHYV